MIILLKGKDKYRQTKVLKEILLKYDKAKVSSFEFGSDNDGIGSLTDEERQTSIFREKKLLITFGLLENFGVGKDLIPFLKRCTGSGDTVLVLVEEKAFPKRKAISDLIGETHDVGPIKEDQLESWVRSEFRSRGGDIDAQALRRLVGIVGNDLWALSGEIDKLISYTAGEKASLKEVSILVKPKLETDIFKAIDAMAAKDRKTALKLVYAHLEKGDSIPYILSMIGFQFRNLNLVKNDNGSAADLGLHPFVFRKASAQSKRFSKDELREIYGKIVSGDVGIKTGKAEPGAALDLFIFGLRS